MGTDSFYSITNNQSIKSFHPSHTSKQIHINKNYWRKDFKEMTTAEKTAGVVATIFSAGLFLLVKHINSKYHFTVGSISKRELIDTGEKASTDISKMYSEMISVYDGHKRGSGTCPLKAYGAVQSLIDGKKHTFRREARALVRPKDFSGVFSKNLENKFEPLVNHQSRPDGSVFLIARPSKLPFINSFTSDLSQRVCHFAAAVKINGKLYVLETGSEKKNLKKTRVIYELLEEHQHKLKEKDINQFDILLYVGQIDNNYQLAEPQLETTSIEVV